jgi:hypothetical protein
MSYVRTPEHRALRAELIRRWRPWEQSSGPKTDAGKAVVAMNSWRGNQRGTISAANRLARLISADDLALASPPSRDPSEG